MSALVGMDLGDDGGNEAVELLNGVESLCTPLSSYPLSVLGNSCSPSLEYSDWVVQLATTIYRLVGVPCEGFEGHFLGYSDSYRS